MKPFLIFLLSFFFFSCQDVKKSNENTNHFFDFDEIEYYHKDISLQEWVEIARKENKTSEEIALLKILNTDYPTSIKDLNFIAELEKLYSEKTKIEKSKFKEIGDIFSEKYYGNYELYGCEPFYRDILVFKSNNKIVGISKICFECSLHCTIGTKKNTKQLGQNGDYAKLKVLLKK